MYKVGDIVLLREDVDSLYTRNLHKGDWYVVLGVMEYGGSQFISIKDENLVAAWYLSSIFNPVFLNGSDRANSQMKKLALSLSKRAVKESGMFKVGDAVEISKSSSYTGLLDFVDGKTYFVEQVKQHEDWYKPLVYIANESGRKDWYHHSHFKLREKKKSEVVFHVGQKVWDVVRGEGVVTYIEEDEEYPVYVEFDGEEESYTTEGKYRKDHEFPSLYAYKPKIVKAGGNEDTPFIPVFEDGDLVQVKFVGSEEIHGTVFVVEKETKDAIYMKGNHFFLKSQISTIYSLYREDIKLELANTL